MKKHYRTGYSIFAITLACLTLCLTYTAKAQSTPLSINASGVYLAGASVFLPSTIAAPIPSSLTLVTRVNQTAVCEGSSVAASVTATGGTAPYTYAWEAPSGASITGASNNSYVTVNGLTSGIKTFTVTVTGSGGSPVSTSTVSVTVNPNPTVVITPGTNLTFCEGSSLTLTGSGTNVITYLWSNGGTSSSIVASVSQPYSLTVTSPAGCTAATTVNVTRYNRPTGSVSALPSLTVCEGQSVTLTASPGSLPARVASTFAAPTVSYTWSTGSNSTATTFIPTSNTVVSLTVNDGVCTSLPINTSITVKSVSSVSVTAAPSATITCANPGVTLTASGSSGYSWDNSSTATTRVVSASGVYSVSATNNGCTTTASVTVTGSSAPPTISITPFNASILTVCAGSSLNLTASGAGTNGSYRWVTGEMTAAISVSTTNTYSVTGTTQSGCTSVTSVYVDIHSLPTATISALPALTVCAGRSISLTASGMPGGLSPRLATTYSAPALWYTWSTGSTDATTIFTPTSTTVISLTINDGSCTGTTAATVTVTSSPTVNIASSATSLTVGQSTSLTASGADSYTWSTNATTNPITVAPLSTTVYSVTGTRNGCTGVASQTIAPGCTDVVAKAISATVVSVLGPNNCSVTMQGQGTGSSFIMTGPNGYVFSTVYRRVGTYSLSAPKVQQPGTYTFTASATNACGQVYSDSITYIVTGTPCP